MFKIRLLNPTNIYYVAMLIAGVAVLISAYVLISCTLALSKTPALPEKGMVTPQEQTLNKVIELIDNQVLQNPISTISAIASSSATEN